MFRPIYTITNKLLRNIKDSALLIAELNRCSLPQVVVMELEQRAVTLSAHTSTSIEGNPLPLTEVKRLLKSRPEHLRDTEQEVVNYNEALETLNRELRSGSLSMDVERILRIHAMVLRNLAEPWFCGRVREEPVVVNDPATRSVVYLPPDFKDVKPLVEDLVDFTSKNRGSLDPLLLAGLFHKQFVIIHPFTDGNGRTARLATKVLLAAMGLDTFPLFSFENYYNQNVSRYFAEVGLRGDYYDLKDQIDFTAWLEYFTDGIIDELQRVKKQLSLAAASPETELKPHHELLLDHIRQHGYITDATYAALTDRAKATRALDFRKLIEMGLIQRLGRGRNTHYKLSD